MKSIEEKSLLDIENKFLDIYSRGSSTEKQLWNAVGKIVNKKAVFERQDDIYQKMFDAAGNLLKEGKYISPKEKKNGE